MELPHHVVFALMVFLLFFSGAAILTFLIMRYYCSTTSSENELERGYSNARVTHGEDHAMAMEEPPLLPTTDKDSVHRLSWREVETLTRNFSCDAVIGEGGSTTVYLAHLSSSPVAMKVYNHADSDRLHRAFRQELGLLLRLRHRCIPRLLGYCNEVQGHVHGAIVLPYFPNGTLHDKLHGQNNGGLILNLPWARRMAIALGIAQALEYMHECCDPHIIHGDLKTANVLLDENFEPVLCDFGSAHVGFLGTTAGGLMMGSSGYVDPHYLRTGVASKKSDVYSYGVLLLEMITGALAYCEEKERTLPAMAGKQEVVVDPRMNGEYHASEAAALGLLALKCVGEKPSLRPSMSEVIKFIGNKMPTASSPDLLAKLQ